MKNPVMGRAAPAFDLISADSHVVEPPDLWTQWIDSRLGDRDIRLRWSDETGHDAAHCEAWRVTASVRGQ